MRDLNGTFAHADCLTQTCRGANFLGTQAFTLVEVMLVVALIALLALMALPNVARARQTAQDAAMQKELQSVYAAITMFQAQNGRAPTSLIELRPYITIDETKYEFNPN